MKSFVTTILLLVGLLGNSHAFVASPTFSFAPKRVSSCSLQMTVLSYNGKKKNFKAGSPLSKAVAALGVKPTYSCKKGDCATCEIFLAGRLTKPCVAKVPPEPKLKSLQEKGLEIRV